jgi:hypothetical protein
MNGNASIRKEAAMTTTSRELRMTGLLSATVAAVSLSGCTLLKIQSPVADAVVTLPSTTHVVLTSTYSISNVKVSVDGNDVSGQINYDSASGNYIGDLTLAAGSHNIVASADAYCSTCSPQVQHVTDSRMFCVAGPDNRVTKTVFVQADGLALSSTGARTAAVATDSGTLSTQWILFPKGTGFTSIPGMIQSKQFPCSCVRSPNSTDKAAVELAPCDINDPRQVWEGTRVQVTGGVAFYQFLSQGGASNFPCLAEGGGGMLIQTFCTSTPPTSDQLWKVLRKDNGQFEGDLTPWSQ